MEKLSVDGFISHGECYRWTPELIWLHAVSDALIALAYFSISAILFHLVRSRKDLPYPFIFFLFCAFIAACGAMHALEVWTIWHGHYFLTGSVKALTAGVSLFTAVALVRVIPTALEIDGPGALAQINDRLEERMHERTVDLEQANKTLEREIADRKHAEAEVNRLNALLQRRLGEIEALFNVLPVGVGIAEDPECIVIRTNNAFAETLGLSTDANASMSRPDSDIVGRFKVLHAGREMAPDALPMQVCARENRVVENFEETVVRADGRRADLLVNAVPLRDITGNATGCVATFQDITILKAAQKSTARYAAIVESSRDAIIGKDNDGIVTDWNPSAERIFGYTAGEMIGESIEILYPDGPIEREVDHRRKIIRGEAESQHESVRRKKDGTLVDVFITMSPIRNESGEITGISLIVRDITTHKRLEAQREVMDRRLQETQKLESLGVLAGGIAHDFNNLLTGILGNASLAMIDTSKSSPAYQCLDEISTASRRAADLCNQMLAYSGRGKFTIGKIDVNHIINDTVTLIKASIGTKCSLQFRLSKEMPVLQGDATQLRQVIMNLVINAAEAIGDDSGIITISTGTRELSESYQRSLTHDSTTKRGSFVYVEVSDTGSGMKPEVVSRIFDPFYTTKFSGRGLGLAAALGIVRGHQGAIKVYSEPGHGTSVRILFPATEGAVEQTATPEVPRKSFSSDGRVLVVDDEAAVRRVASRMLGGMGFSVNTANNGAVAVEIFAANPGGYRLVLLDLTMPGMNGEEAFRRMREIREDVPIILMSGFSEQEAVTRFAGCGLAGFVQKPFDVDVLGDTVREVLSG